ncbi:MAG: acyl-CoA thioesterase [Planktomarina sp.]|nr:acyl-CoA thioesterase [Planktomarina sp.]
MEWPNMYPFVRLAWQFFLHRNDPSLMVGDVHTSSHYCLPWDLDVWMELNNGRALSLYDMGRIPMAKRSGLIAALKRRSWGLSVAGSSVRYRKRIRVLDKIEMRSTAICADHRFMYLEQSMWVKGICAGHALYRTVVTDADGIVATSDVLEELGLQGSLPSIPDWVAAWIYAEDLRPWPPMQMPQE